MARARVAAAIAVAVGVGLSPAVAAEDVAVLRSQVDQLSQKNVALRQRIQKQRETTQYLTKTIDTLHRTSDALKERVSQVTEASAGSKIDDDAAQLAGTSMPKLILKVHGDIPFEYRFDSDGEVRSNFVTGRHNMFVQGNVTDELTVLLEHGWSAQTDIQVINRADLHRASARYTLSDALKIELGMHDTPLGYWSQTYQRADYLQTPIERPDIYRYQRDTTGNGAILPVNGLGVTLSGLLETESTDFKYATGLYNGREKNRSVNQGFGDDNDFKALSTLIGFVPRSLLPGLEFGGSVYVDRIPPIAIVIGGGTMRRESMDELILGSYAAYVRDRWELLGEFFWIDHDDNQTEHTFKTVGAYVQGSYSMGKFTPYYRIDVMDFGQGDPYYADLEGVIVVNRVRNLNPNMDHVTHTFGFRWDAFPWNAIKVEYNLIDNHGQDQDDEHVLALNSSYLF